MTDIKEERVVVKLQLPRETYDTAKAEAARNGIACVGSQVRMDVVRYYQNVAYRRARKYAAREK